MAKEQDLVFKAKSVGEAKSLNKLMQDINDDIVRAELEDIVQQSRKARILQKIDLTLGPPDKTPISARLIKYAKNRVTVHTQYTDRSNWESVKLPMKDAKKLLKTIQSTMGKDALGVAGAIPLDTRAMNEESQFKMVRQILGNLGLKNVPKPI